MAKKIIRVTESEAKDMLTEKVMKKLSLDRNMSEEDVKKIVKEAVVRKLAEKNQLTEAQLQEWGFGDVVHGAKKVGSSIGNGLSNGAHAVAGKAGGAASKLYNGVRDMPYKAADKAVNALGNAADKATDFARDKYHIFHSEINAGGNREKINTAVEALNALNLMQRENGSFLISKDSKISQLINSLIPMLQRSLKGRVNKDANSFGRA